MCVCMRVRVRAFVPVIFLLDFCMFYVRMFYGPSWSDLNKYNTIIQLLLEVVYYVGLDSCKKFLLQSYWPCDYNVLFLLSFTGKERWGPHPFDVGFPWSTPTPIWPNRDSVQEWEKDWLIEFNTSKCEAITFTRKTRPVKAKYNLHGTTLETVTSAKGKSLELEQPQYFVDGRGTLQAKKGR